jgi:hypothetical protein
MANALRKHWAKVFSSKAVSGQRILDEWMDRHPYGLPRTKDSHNEDWKVNLDHVELVVKLSNNSSPGPDGIPYAAWRKAGRQALVILTVAVAEIQADNFDENTLPEGFNTSYLCCLPKKPSGTDQEKG